MRQREEKRERAVKDQVAEYKNDFLSYFEMKLTKQEIILESTNGGGPITKVPKRKKNNVKDTVESIASNVHTLIHFGREQKAKLNELKKIP